MWTELLGAEKFKYIWINMGGQLLGCCKSWQHQPLKHCMNVLYPNMYIF